MMRWRKHLQEFFVGMVIGMSIVSFIKLFTVYPPKTLSDVGAVATALGVFLALMTYWHQKNRDRAVSVGDQVGFFRNVILELETIRADELFNLKQEFPSIDIREIKEIEEFSFRWFNAQQFKNVRAQFEIKKRLETKHGYKYAQKTLSVLNALEEFCIKIEANKIVENEGLMSLRSAFVQIINQCAFHIPYQRKSYDNQNMYAAIERVYSKWYPTVKMRTPEEIKSEVQKEFDDAEEIRRGRNMI